MLEWAMIHPLFTFILAFCVLLCIESTLREWARAFGNRRNKED